MCDISKLSNVIIDGVNYSFNDTVTNDLHHSHTDYLPDVTGAYIASADYDGEPMNQQEIMRLNEDHPDLVQDLAIVALSQQ